MGSIGLLWVSEKIRCRIFQIVKIKQRQDCIPVGCVSSTTVAVCWRGSVCLRGGCLPGGGVSPPVDRMTDMCKNITSLRTVINIKECFKRSFWFLIDFPFHIDGKGERKTRRKKDFHALKHVLKRSPIWIKWLICCHQLIHIWHD